MRKQFHNAIDEASSEVALHDECGLSTGPARRLSIRAREFECETRLETAAGRAADAKDLLQLLLLGVGPGERVTVRCRGRNASAAAAAITGVLETIQRGDS